MKRIGILLCLLGGFIDGLWWVMGGDRPSTAAEFLSIDSSTHQFQFIILAFNQFCPSEDRAALCYLFFFIVDWLLSEMKEEWPTAHNPLRNKLRWISFHSFNSIDFASLSLNRRWGSCSALLSSIKHKAKTFAFVDEMKWSWATRLSLNFIQLDKLRVYWNKRIDCFLWFSE